MTYPSSGPTPPALDYPGHRARRPTWLWIALALAVAIIVVLAAVVISQSKDDGGGTPTAAMPPSYAVQPAPQPTAAPPVPNAVTGQSMTCQGFTASVDANSQPGWHATIDSRGVAYAVPPEWTVAPCGVRMGWARPCPEGQCVIQEIGAAATVANPACPKQNLAMAGITQSTNADIRTALQDEASKVPTIYTKGQQTPTVALTPLREFTIGNRPAVQMVATVNGITTDSCNGSSAVHSMVVTTVPNVEGSVVFLISLRQGVNATPNPGVIDKIVATVHAPA